MVFESLLMLFPASHNFELARPYRQNPKPRVYSQVLPLLEGGSQGALTGLQHKGLIYGPEQGYRLCRCWWICPELTVGRLALIHTSFTNSTLPTLVTPGFKLVSVATYNTKSANLQSGYF